MKFRVPNLVKRATGFDLFGVPVGVNYDGEETYNTYLSSLCSAILIVFMIINLVMLSIDFSNGKQQEKTSFE